MARYTMMHQAARWHIWLGWAAAIPLLLWTISGLVMVIRPLEEVRGTTLRIEAEEQALPAGFVPAAQIYAAGPAAISNVRLAMRFGEPSARVTYADGTTALFDARDGRRLTPLDQAAVHAVALRSIKGASDTITGEKLFEGKDATFDLRRPLPAWQISLADGTHVYIGRDTGEVEAVRTPFWRFYDFMWGLHIMDPVEREDTHHPVIIVSVLFALVSCVLGTVLLFRRRKAARA